MYKSAIELLTASVASLPNEYNVDTAPGTPVVCRYPYVCIRTVPAEAALPALGQSFIVTVLPSDYS